MDAPKVMTEKRSGEARPARAAPRRAVPAAPSVHGSTAPAPKAVFGGRLAVIDHPPRHRLKDGFIDDLITDPYHPLLLGMVAMLSSIVCCRHEMPRLIGLACCIANRIQIYYMDCRGHGCKQ